MDRAKYFLDNVSDNLLCPICFDVFTVPVFLKCCGKTLCNGCWSKSMKTRTNCPMCRDNVPKKERSMKVMKNLVVDDCIQEMKVKCMHNKDPATCTCLWVGKLSEWKKHGSDDCELSVHACPISGCDFTGTRKELYNHNISNMIRHSDLLTGPKIAALERKHKREVAILKKKIDEQNVSPFSIGDIIQLKSRKASKEQATIVAVRTTYDVINTETGRKTRCVKADAMEKTSASQAPRVGQPLEFDNAINYVKTIKKRFADEPETYKKFLAILRTFQNEQRGIKEVNEVLEKVSVLFEEHSDLLKGFIFFLPDAERSETKEQLEIVVKETEKRRARKLAAAT